MNPARLHSAAAVLGTVCSLRSLPPDALADALAEAFVACGGKLRPIRIGPRRTLHADLCGLTGRHNHRPDQAVRHWLKQARRRGQQEQNR